MSKRVFWRAWCWAWGAVTLAATVTLAWLGLWEDAAWGAVWLAGYVVLLALDTRFERRRQADQQVGFWG